MLGVQPLVVWLLLATELAPVQPLVLDGVSVLIRALLQRGLVAQRGLELHVLGGEVLAVSDFLQQVAAC